MAEQFLYKKPYLDSDVFIGWIKGERIPLKDKDGKEVFEERGIIGEHLLKLAEQRVFPVVISALSLAEVHKHKGKEKLEDSENEKIMDYFEHDFINVIPITRKIGEEANKLCRKYQSEKLSPNDAIHLACAKKAGCYVLLSWDRVLNSITEPGIRIEKPVMWNPPEKKRSMEQMNLYEEDQKDSAKSKKGE